MKRDHDHYYKPKHKGSWWLTREGIKAIIFLVFIGFFLIIEHQAHIYNILPWCKF